MRRHHHLLTIPQTARYPGQVVVLDVGIVRTPDPGNANIEIATHSGWVACGFSGAAGVYGPDHWESGTDAQSFWDRVRARLKKGGHIWLFAQRASTVLGLLGIWDLIEDGEWVVKGADYRDRSSATEGDVRGVRAAGGSAGTLDATAAGDNVQGLQHVLGERGGGGRASPAKSGRSGGGLACLEDPPTILDIAPAGSQGKLRILDTRNYGVDSLPESVPPRERVARWAQFVRDMVRVCRDHKLGGLQCTSASQSMTAWRYGYYTHPVQCHTHPGASAIEDAAYVGGRCEAFRLGALPGPVWHMDVSAMYPHVYGEERVPVALRSVGDGMVELVAALGQSNATTVAEVGLETNEPCYPKKDARLKITVWPVGRFHTTLCGPELKDAHDKGRIRSVARVAVYDSAPAMHAYAVAVGRLRALPGISPECRRWAKSIGVCLVGKLGQRDRCWVSAPWPAYCEPWQTWWADDGEGHTYRWRSVAWHTQWERVGGWSYHAVPGIAAHICSAARMRLLAMIRCAHWGDVYYVDTDSLFVSGDGHRRLCEGGWVQAGVPGKLRCLETGDTVRMYGIKTYTFAGREVAAGKSAPVDCYTSTGARVWVERRAAESCRIGAKPDNARVSIPFERRSIYRHGTRNADGTVSPLIYSEF